METREELENLVAEAQQLVELAIAEAARIVSDTRERTAERAQELVSQAEELRVAAETEAGELLEEAKEIRRMARVEADQLLAHARKTHDQMIDSANEIRAQPSSAEDLKQARTEVDRILRLARAEAEARSAEIVEAARRKVENMEIEARNRVEQLKREQRELQRRLREEELDVRARIAGLETPAQKPPVRQTPVHPAVVESRSSEPPAPAARSVPIESPTRPEVPVATEPVAISSEDFEDLDYSESNTSIRARLSEETDDPEVLKALKAFRRRT